MKRLYLTVEGDTEATTAVDVLRPHLAAFNVFVLRPRLTGPHGRRRGRIPRGGMFTFHHALSDMRRWMKEDRSVDARFSMMVDLYRLPADFPGYAESRGVADPLVRAARLEAALTAELGDRRFIPYLQVHEFEALILSRPESIQELYDVPNTVVAELQRDCAAYPSPEHVDEGQESHPKARLQEVVRHCDQGRYSENVAGPLLVGAIGLAELREKCAHFGQWLTILESLDRGGNS
jgi:hypothetical protein